MATAGLSMDDSHENIDDKHLEIFCLIWLDANANVTETRNTEQKLRSIINHLKKFQDVEQCREYIGKRSQKDRLVLIVSGQMGHEIVPSIHKLRQVISIYVYCMDKKRNEQWACKFKKVKAVVVDLNELLSRIEADHKIQKKIEEPLSINIFTAGKSTAGVNGEFIFSQVLIDCLLRLKSTEIDQKELIHLCQNQYQGNPDELSNIREFQNKYSSNKVLWWYTKESFFYKTLNAALRKPNIHTIFLFRTYISDIQSQLQKYQSKKSLRVYRSQMISSDELKTLQQSLGQLISVNSFFSTSTDYERALSFLEMSDVSDDLERVLFQIDADPKIGTTKPFANISAHSEFIDEAEVLFMLGSIFRLQTINQNDDQVWIIRMTLCSDDEHDLKQVLTYMKHQTGDGETNLQILGKILRKMGKFDLAEKYLNRLLEELPSNDPLLSQLYEDLGELASQMGNYDMSVQWHQKSLEFKNKHESTASSSTKKANTLIEQITPSLHINSNTKWKQNGLTVAGGNGKVDHLNQLSHPIGIYVDDDEKCIYIADMDNHRIVQWKFDAKIGQVVAGGNGQGHRMNQLNKPTDMTVDKKTDSLIICDSRNRRVVQWPRRNGTNGETIISDIDCRRLAMDKNGDLYVSDDKKHAVRRWKTGEKEGTIVAGGNGDGNQLNRLNYPNHLFVDEDHSVYVSDWGNHRVMKWVKGAKEGVVVAGGQGAGDNVTQLHYPRGVIVDHFGNVYVNDFNNHRTMCWSKGSKKGRVIVGGNGEGQQPNQFNTPMGLSFDRQGHLYVVDTGNYRVQKFEIESN